MWAFLNDWGTKHTSQVAERPERDKSDKSMKFGTQFDYTLPNDIRRGAHDNLFSLPF